MSGNWLTNPRFNHVFRPHTRIERREKSARWESQEPQVGHRARRQFTDVTKNGQKSGYPGANILPADILYYRRGHDTPTTRTSEITPLDGVSFAYDPRQQTRP